MGWVRGIREVRHITVAIDGTLVGMKRGPVMTRTERVVVELPREAWARLMHFNVSLPLATGAGPCGTFAQPGVPALAWSIEHLVEPLRAYYATYVPPMRFGAKPGPRGRRAAAERD